VRVGSIGLVGRLGVNAMPPPARVYLAQQIGVSLALFLTCDVTLDAAFLWRQVRRIIIFTNVQHVLPWV
jgi:hypothetical protein